MPWFKRSGLKEAFQSSRK